MHIFRPTPRLATGLALALALLGAQAVHAQDTTATDQTTSSSAVASSEATTAAPAAQSESSSSAAAAPVAQSESSSAAPVAPAVAQLNPIDPPPAGKGQVVFFRPSGKAGMALTFSIHEGNTGIVKLPSGTYFVWVTDPGDKEYSIQSEATDTLHMEVEEGETYYVVQSMAMGFFVGRPNLTPSTEAVFEAKKLKLSAAKATDRH